MKRLCSGCKTIKPISNFYKYRNTFWSYCKSCSKQRGINFRKSHPNYRRVQTLASYGVSVEEYSALLSKQNGVCAICKRVCASGDSLSIDHNHQTGEVRGLLCKRCNLVLGNAQESILLLESAIDYLVRY